jgi:hypothetical protein
LDYTDIELVISQVGFSRAAAVTALKENDHYAFDLVLKYKFHLGTIFLLDLVFSLPAAWIQRFVWADPVLMKEVVTTAAEWQLPSRR